MRQLLYQGAAVSLTPGEGDFPTVRLVSRTDPAAFRQAIEALCTKSGE